MLSLNTWLAGSKRSAPRRWRCAACGLHDSAGPFCTGCEADYFPRDITRCPQCARTLPASVSGHCGQCLTQAPNFDATLACAHYGPPISAMVLALKKGGQLSLARAFGQLMASRIDVAGMADAMVCPVPLNAQRLRERGFNQALEIARAFARALDVPLHANALARTPNSKAQQALKLHERRRNVRGVFRVQADVRDRHVVVIDDVMTSGSTLDEIARCLKRAGARRVSNVVLARTG